MNRQALLLVNRHARQGQRSLSEAIALLNDLGFDLLLESTARRQNLSDTIRRYSDRVDMVIVGGGDGTLNAAVEGLVDTQLPLAILPLGTANDLARTLNLPTALPQACQVIAQGKLQPIDLGWVNGKHFFNVASLGLSVKITRQLDKETKRRWGVLAYGISAFQVLLKFRPFSAEIRINGESQKVRTAQIAVGNGRHYGGGLTVAADAAIDDQRLDLYSLEIQHWWQMLALLPSMRSGTLASWSFVRTMHGQEIEIYTRRPHAINTDGEITTETPARFRVIPKAISVVIP
jgi:YegS/Rv2252/BmrU family lipid kinase